MRRVRNRDQDIAFTLTTQRRLLLEAIRGCQGHLDASELLRRAREGETPEARSISLATVYRNLRLFRDLGLVDERRLGRLGRHYEAHRSREHQHFVCQRCGRVMEFDSPLVDRLVAAVQKSHRVRVTRTELCLEGQCPGCHGSGMDGTG